MTTDNILAPIAALALPDSARMSRTAVNALAFIEQMQVDSAESYGFAADELMAVKLRAKAIEDQRTKLTKPINTAIKEINDMFREPANVLARAEALLKSKMLVWDQEQERIATAARRKAEEAAQVERQRLAAEAAERQREAEAQAAAAAKAIAQGNMQAAELARAASDRAAAEAQAAVATAQMVIAAPPDVDRAKVVGISTSKKIDFEVVDTMALIAHVAAHPELAGLLVVDSVRMRAYVRGLGLACALPGVRVYEDRVLSARAAR